MIETIMAAMAFAGVTLIQPWEEEVGRIVKTLRLSYSDKANLLFLVHPGSGRDCDSKEAAKEGVIKELEEAVRNSQRAILIYPAEGGTYIDPTHVTDIRGGFEERKWIERKDLSGITQATFAGGKLTRCLGYSYERFVQIARQEGIREVRVRLPLNSIYTEAEYTAAQEFLAGASAIGEVESICALLTPDNSETLPDYDKSFMEYGFLGVRQPWITKLYFNGKHIGTIGGKQDSIPFPAELEDAPHSQSTLEINLLVECNTGETFDHRSLGIKATKRWERIREDFIPYLQKKDK
jgi:hypothetical protein